METTMPQPRMKTVFHCDLNDAHAGEDYWLQACGKRYPLLPHTAETRAAARARSSTLAALPEHLLTHYTATAVDLPADRVVRVHSKHTLRHRPGAAAQAGFGQVAIHIPPPQAIDGAHASDDTAFHGTLNYVTSAQALLFHHPDLMNMKPETARIVFEHINDVDIQIQISALAQLMLELGPPAEQSGWAQLTPFTPPASDLKGCDGKKTYYHATPAPEVMQAAGNIVTALMIATKNDLRLQGQKWTQSFGSAVSNMPHTPAGVQLTADAGSASWKAAVGNTSDVYGCNASVQVMDATQRKLKLTIRNTYIRYLGAYIRFFDACDQPLKVPDWTIDGGGGFMQKIYDQIQYDDLRYLGHIQPINTVLAIPVADDPGVLEVGITFPKDAVSARIYASGLGTGADPWPLTPVVGGMLTGLLNLGVPTFMLAFGAATQSSKPLYDIVNELTDNEEFLALIFAAAAEYLAIKAEDAAINKKMDWHLFSSVMTLLFNKSVSKLLLYVEAETAAEEAVDEIPFAGWLVLAIDIAVGVAQMAETIVEVAMSPWNIENTLATTIDTAVDVLPDPRGNGFPQLPAGPGHTARLVVKMIYQNQSRPTVMIATPLPGGAHLPSLRTLFAGNTLGGQVKFEAEYYVDDYLAGKATSGVMKNDAEHVGSLQLVLVEYPKKLGADSVYQHASLLTYQNQAYTWQTTTRAPTATIAATDTRSDGNAMSVWSGLALSQRHGAIGIGWKAAGTGLRSCASGQGGQLYALQTLGVGAHPASAGQFSSCGLDGQTLIVCDPYPPTFLMRDGQWQLDANGRPLPDPQDHSLGDYYIDPRKAANDAGKDGGHHLRKLVLAPPTPFNMAATQLSHGRFPFQPDSVALHPAGYAIAVNSEFGKIQIVALAPDGVADADAPMARVYAGRATVPNRPGLLFHPVAVSCAYDGTVLVLEDTKSGAGGPVLARIQAFDVGGLPVNRFFDSQQRPTPFLELSGSGDHTYLDIAAVGDHAMTYMYVLYYSGDGAQAADYHLAIYQYGASAPATNPLVVTDAMAASRIGVDMWHALYALNYAMVTDGDGKPAGPQTAGAGPAGRTVPSVSLWLPRA